MSNGIFKWKIIWFYLHYSHTRFVYTKLRLRPQQIIRLITTLLFAEFSHIRHGPFDILGGGAWAILEKNFLALILTKKNKLAQWHSEKNNLSPIV